MKYRNFCVLALCCVGSVLAEFDKEAFEGQLLDAIDSLHEELDWLQLKHIAIITKKISSAKSFDTQEPSILEPTITAAVSAFMKKEAGPFDDSEDDLKVFDEIFETYIIDACNSIVSELEPSIRAYDENKNNEAALKKLDTKMLQWLTTSKICSAIIHDESTIYVDTLVTVMGTKQLEAEKAASHRMATRSTTKNYA